MTTVRRVLALLALMMAGCSGGEEGGTDSAATPTPPGALRISEIQQSLISVGATVDLRSVVVTGVGTPATKGFWAQDAGGGAWSGIWFVDLDGVAPALAPGDVVDVEGAYLEYPGASTDSLSEILVDSVVVTSNGAAITTSPVTLQDLSDSWAESWEGCLVEVGGAASIENIDAGFGEYRVSDGVTTLLIDDAAFASVSYLEAGDSFERLAGLVHFGFGEYKLEPRSAADAVPAPPVSFPATVAQLQDESAGDHVAAGTIVSIVGVLVVATDARASGIDFWVQEPGGGPHSGIHVYDAASLAPPVTRGDIVTVIGARYVEAQIPISTGETQARLQLKARSTVTITGTGSESVAAVTFPALLGNPEPYEGVLVEVLDDPAELPSPDGFLEIGSSEFLPSGFPIHAGTIGCENSCVAVQCLCVDLAIYDSKPDLPSAPATSPWLSRVRGIVHFGGPYPARHEILPRDRCDVISTQTPPTPPCP